jgi:hypothetical protein
MGLDLRIDGKVPMRVIAIFPFIQEPAIGPNLGGPQNQLTGPQDDAHRFVVEYEREACHTDALSKAPASEGLR